MAVRADAVIEWLLDGDPAIRWQVMRDLGAQLENGGWNCHVRNRPSTRHSSLHTTFNVLEGLAHRGGARGDPGAPVPRGRDAGQLMLQHRLLRSDCTGEVISERLTHLTYPWHWHHTVLRGLDYLRFTPAIDDERIEDAIKQLRLRATMVL